MNDVYNLSAARLAQVEKYKLAREKYKYATEKERQIMKKIGLQYQREIANTIARITDIIDKTAEQPYQVAVIQIAVKGKKYNKGTSGEYEVDPETATRLTKWRSIMSVIRFHLTQAGYFVIDRVHNCGVNSISLAGQEDIAGPTDYPQTTVVSWDVWFGSN
jgi:hypothetical protein